MSYIVELLARAEKIKAERKARYAVETLAEALAALDVAQARYDKYPSSSNAYDKAAVQDRAVAAKARVNANFQTTAEWSATPNGQEFMELPPSAGTLNKLRRYKMI